VITAFGAVSSWLGLLVVPVAVLLGTAFSMPMAALSARVEEDRVFVTIFRFLIVPMFLFSGAFFPVSQLPLAFELVAYVTPIWHGVELCRMLTLGEVELVAALGHVGYLLAWALIGFELARRAYRRRLLR
jgi:lipooligosaccharide transport system permease protein